MRNIRLGIAGWLGFAGLICLAVTPVAFKPERWDIVRALGYAALLFPLLGGVWSLARYFAARVSVDGVAATSAKYALALNAVALVMAFLAAPWLLDGKVHGRAPQSISLNNIKQLAVGVMVYAQDYNETFPGWVRNPDEQYAHNTWDELIDPCIKSKDVYHFRDTGIRSYSDPGTRRILSYGLNGLLITPPKATPDGDADFASVNADHPPKPLSPDRVANPGGTILFAELSTAARMPGLYGQDPDPRPYTFSGSGASREWKGAWPGWIDISPRAFIEIARGRRANPYREPYGRNADSGIARDLYGGGGCYAFCDGHVQFMKIGKSVGLGTTTKKGLQITEDNCWSPENTNNMWIPRREGGEG